MASLRDILNRPFAGPEMRKKYEAALGEFLVSFNAMENYMRYSVEGICKSLGKAELWGELTSDDFSRQLKNLRLLSLAEPFFLDTPFDRMETLNNIRNKLAHGHYDQDLFSDDYEIVGKKNRIRMSIQEIKKATEEAEDLSSDIGWTLRKFWEPEETAAPHSY
ncbi:hypothetical protein GFL92_09365 [Rhizobium leguminosarum bv. viciae]|nr:hypothetical protein [Rhizobium leguminosarum bv. viciae]TCB49066.1 hypothetical protein E0J20_27000 [Rhizobium leguminosarum bv. viciae]